MLFCKLTVPKPKLVHWLKVTNSSKFSLVKVMVYYLTLVILFVMHLRNLNLKYSNHTQTFTKDAKSETSAFVFHENV